jgi:cell wall-associated NlpC family hydrolase
MKIRIPVAAVLCVAFAWSLRAAAQQSSEPPPQAPAFWSRALATIDRYLGRPYAWGATGLKSFDCSGFVWRVMYDNGILMKRTTARKFYMILPKPEAGERYASGSVVFFDNLKHCGIVNDKGSFFHAQTSVGTNLSQFTPFWKAKIVGFRKIPEK